MTYRITGLDPALFSALVHQPPEVLALAGAERRQVDACPGFPCRITLEDAPVGETVLLLNHPHMSLASPYRQSGAIFVREGARRAGTYVNEIPPALRRRLLSVRAYSAIGHILDAEVVEGEDLPGLIARFWHNRDVAFAHAHNARQGCFAATIERA